MFLTAVSLLLGTTEAKKPRKSYNGREEGKLYFEFAQRNIPHSEKIEKGGEDAWFVDEDFMTVADGVGGWAEEGIDAGLYSRQLVSDIHTIY